MIDVPYESEDGIRLAFQVAKAYREENHEKIQLYGQELCEVLSKYHKHALTKMQYKYSRARVSMIIRAESRYPFGRDSGVEGLISKRVLVSLTCFYIFPCVFKRGWRVGESKFYPRKFRS